MRYVLLFLVCAFAAAGAHAEIHKWVDSQGRVHYSDQPPPPKATPRPLTVEQPPGAAPAAPAEAAPAATPATPAETAPAAAQQPAPAAAPSGGTAPKTTAEKELEFRKRRMQEEEAKAKQERAQQEAKQREQNCTQARNNLRTLQEGGRIYTLDEKGERVYMDDTARQQALANAQKAVDSWCK